MLRVLVVEDDVEVRKSVTRLLEVQGFAVSEAADGAIARSMVDRRTFDVIMCDVCMPRLDGIQFFQWLQRTNPALSRRLLFMTGWASDPSTGAFLPETGQPILQKPFDNDALIAAIRMAAERTAS